KRSTWKSRRRTAGLPCEGPKASTPSTRCCAGPRRTRKAVNPTRLPGRNGRAPRNGNGSHPRCPWFLPLAQRPPSSCCAEPSAEAAEEPPSHSLVKEKAQAGLDAGHEVEDPLGRDLPDDFLRLLVDDPHDQSLRFLVDQELEPLVEQVGAAGELVQGVFQPGPIHFPLRVGPSRTSLVVGEGRRCGDVLGGPAGGAAHRLVRRGLRPYRPPCGRLNAKGHRCTTSVAGSVAQSVRGQPRDSGVVHPYHRPEPTAGLGRGGELPCAE